MILPKRKLYKFNHSICQGGYLYAHKTLNEELIKNKKGLRNLLSATSNKFQLIDVTIKIYDSIFFLFFMEKPSVHPLKVIESIQKHIGSFNKWDKKYICTGVYDLQEEYIRKDLNKFGFDYDKW